MVNRTTVPVNLRVPPELRERLDAAAKAAGHNLTKEVTARLSASLDASVSERPHLPGLLALAVAMNAAGQQAALFSTGSLDAARLWWNDPYAFEQAMQAANHVLDRLRPSGDVKQPAALSGLAGALDMGAYGRDLGANIAQGILLEIASDEPTRRGDSLRRDLGDELVQRVRGRRKKL